MADYIFEIGVQELPAHSVLALITQIKNIFYQELEQNNLKYTNLKEYSTPRRLCIYIENIVQINNQTTLKLKGPAKDKCFDSNSNPSQALNGFLKKNHLQIEQIFFEKVNQIEYAFANLIQQVQDIEHILQAISLKAITHLNCEKPMRWADLSIKFQRPIDWILALYDNEIIKIELDGIKSSNYTFGHRLDNKKIVLKNPTDYFEAMLSNNIIVDSTERMQTIINRINSMLPSLGAKYYLNNSDLFDEINNLVEFPKIIACSFENEFLELPPLLITTIMVHHQRYIPLYDYDNNLMNKFIVVSNNPNEIAEKNIINGNLKVLKARLEDGKFFYNEDKKIPLSTLKSSLEKLTFQEEFGNYKMKVDRLLNLKSNFLEQTSQKKLDSNLTIIIEHCKLDLTTGMIRELPELQGIATSWYLNNKFEPEIINAISEHYKPLSNSDSLPNSLNAKIVSLLDKLDNMTAFFILGKLPTGAGDPYALKRQASAIIELFIDLYTTHSLSFDLDELIILNINLLLQNINSKIKIKSKEAIVNSLIDFLNVKLKQRYESLNFSSYVYDSICSIENPFKNFKQFNLKIESLNKLLADESNHIVFKCGIRISNIIDTSIATQVKPEILNTTEEQQLWQIYTNKIQNNNNTIFNSTTEIKENFEKLKLLVEPMENFFANVRVNDDDNSIKINRHSILAKINESFLKFADFKKISNLIPIILLFFFIQI